jgi:hypothetical protein
MTRDEIIRMERNDEFQKTIERVNKHNAHKWNLRFQRALDDLLEARVINAQLIKSFESAIQLLDKTSNINDIAIFKSIIDNAKITIGK